MDDTLGCVDDVRREEVEIWGARRVWVWGLTFGQFLALQREAHRPGPDGVERFDPERYAICRLIECVRDSGDPGARPIFRRDRHYDWLRERGAQSIERLLRISMRLSGELDGSDPPASASPSTSARASSASV